jgi:hypothetical protein
MKDRDELQRAFADAQARYDAMTPEQQQAMWEAQRQSWLRSMAPCEHGVRDWETCPDCRESAATEDG